MSYPTLITKPERPCPNGHIGERYANGRCRICARARAKDWKLNHPDRAKASNRKSIKQRRASDPVKAREDSRRNNRNRYQRSRTRMLETNSQWRLRNLDKVRESIRRWRSLNRPGARSAEVAARRAKKKNATPSWVDVQRIKEKYERAKRLSKCLRVKMQVDHIVPLQSDYVCGLHVPWNLRIITAELNVKKSNREWPDMTFWS